MSPFDALHTPRLLLHRLREEDLHELTHMHSDPRVMATLGGVRSPAETAEWLGRQLEHWRQHGFGLWIARDRATGQFAGRGGLHHVEIDGHDEIEVS